MAPKASLPSGAWRSCIATLLLALAPLVVFWRGTLGREVLAPGDGIHYSLPLRLLGMDLLRSGEWPLWNPFVFSGFPLFGQMQTALLYPGTWLLLVLSPEAGMNWQMLTLYSSAAVGTFVYTRAIGCHRGAAVFAGLTFSLGGFLVAHLGHVATPQGAACLPWLLWSLERLRSTARFRFVLVGTLAVALAIVAGHPPTPIYLLLAGGLYAAWFGIVLAPAAGRLRFLGLAAVAVIAAFGLTAVQLWPTAELAGQSVRAKLSFDEFVSYSLPLAQLPLLLFPFFFGGSSFGPYWGAWNLAELTGYVGVAPLMLALAALPSARRSPHTAFWAALAVLAVLLALGDATPLAQQMFRVPGYNLFRAQARNLLLFDLAVAVLAARALSTPSRRALIASAALVAVACTGFAIFAVTRGRSGFASLATRTLGPERGAEVLAAAITPSNPALWLPVVLAVAAAAVLVALARRPTALRLAMLLAFQALDLFVFVELFAHPTLPVATALRPSSPALAARDALSSMPPGRAVLTSDGKQVIDYRWSLWGVPLVNGYDPFLLSRYKELLGNMPYWGQLSAAAVAQRPWAFDALSTRVLVLDEDPGTPSPNGLGVFLAAGESFELVPLMPQRATRVELLTALLDGVDTADGEPVARLTIRDPEGRETALLLRAGRHTAQWTWDASGGAKRIRHRRAPLPEKHLLMPLNAPYYSAALPLPAALDVARLRLEPIHPKGALAVHGVTLRDEATGAELPLRGADALRADPERWVLRRAHRRFAVYENRRARPRAWSVGRTVAMPPEAQLWTLRSGRLPDGQPFDPAEVALIDAAPGGDRGALGRAELHIVSETTTEILLDARATAPAFLVLSEIFYPGWIATVDEVEVPIVRTNYVLRGLDLPAGAHRVRFSYRPTSILYGGIVSGSCALLLLGAGAWRLRGRRRRPEAGTGALPAPAE